MTKEQKTRAIAVFISDVHYSLNTLELADDSMQQAIDMANGLNVPLIVAGDLHDTKANMRAECVNAMLKTFKKVKECQILRGNHDSLNEKSSEHALNFLPEKIGIVAGRPRRYTNSGPDLYLIPYYHDPEELQRELKQIPKGSTLIMHQGISGSNSGEYLQDKTAIRPEDVAGMRVISGHYHTRQTIALPDDGTWDYIGNPYTQNFAEASDPEKGYQVLHYDGSLEFIPTNLRKHVIITAEPDTRHYTSHPEPGDLVWVKVAGSKEWLATQTKDVIRKQTGIEDLQFRLDLIPTTSNEQKRPVTALSQQELLDSLIDQQNASDDLKTRLKQTWRGM